MRTHFITRSSKVFIKPRTVTMNVLANTKEVTSKGVIKNKEQYETTKN